MKSLFNPDFDDEFHLSQLSQLSQLGYGIDGSEVDSEEEEDSFNGATSDSAYDEAVDDGDLKMKLMLMHDINVTDAFNRWFYKLHLKYETSSFYSRDFILDYNWYWDNFLTSPKDMLKVTFKLIKL